MKSIKAVPVAASVNAARPAPVRSRAAAADVDVSRGQYPLSMEQREVGSEQAEQDPGSTEALRVLLESHARFLDFVQRRVGSREVAEDILQEAFVRTLDHAGS